MKSGQDMFKEMLINASKYTRSTGNLIGESMKSIVRVDKLETKSSDNPLKVKYKNWKGEVGVRTIIPASVWYGHTEYHKTDQWLMDVWDIGKNDLRTYAMLDIIEFIKVV